MNDPRWISRRAFTKVMGLAAAGVALPACGRPAHGPDGMPLDGPYASTLLDTMMVPMRDGVRLATDVHVPSRDGTVLEGPWPVILERTPYGRQRPSRSERSLTERDRAKSRAEVVEVLLVGTLGVVATADVLIDDDIASADEDLGDLGSTLRTIGLRQ